MKSIFKNSDLQDLYEKNGYVVINFTKQANIVMAKEVEMVFLNRNSNSAGHFDSLTVDDSPLTSYVHENLMQIFKDDLNNFFLDFKVPICMLLSKRPSRTSGISMHQDPSLLRHEDREIHMGVWIPLIDTDQTNGSMRLIPRSHLIFDPIQILDAACIFSDIRQEIENFAIPINLHTGQALFFDNRILHSSFPNNSLQTRTAAIIRLTHKDSSYISFLYDDEKKEVCVIEQPDDFYIKHKYKSFRLCSQKAIFIEKIPYIPRKIVLSEFQNLLLNA